MNKNIFLLLITLLVLVPILGFLPIGLPNTHDGQDHVARIMAFYKNLEEGVLIPRWGSMLNWGYGHPVLEFLYPLPSYIASFFHFLGLSFFDSIKLVSISGVVFSFIFICSVQICRLICKRGYRRKSSFRIYTANSILYL